MSAQEFFQWQAFELLEGPLGDRRTEVMLAVVGAAISNAVVFAAGGKAQTQPSDLLQDWDRAPKPPPDPAGVAAATRAAFQALMGG